MLLQVEAAAEAARCTARPAKAPFIVGFLTGYELEWLPKVMYAIAESVTLEPGYDRPSPARFAATARVVGCSAPSVRV